MGAVIDYWGGKQGYLSGVRSLERQRELFDTVTDRPVAAPGCSQHNYGFAVDVFWIPIISFRFNIQMTGKQTNDFMETLGESLGLKTVQFDVGHFQIFPGSQFKTWAVSAGFCDPFAGFGFALKQLVSREISSGFADSGRFISDFLNDTRRFHRNV